MEHLEELHELLWSPISSHLDVRHLVIVPHGFLHQLPFHALFDGQQFLIERHAITYSPSAGVFHATRGRRHATDVNGSLVIGSSDHNAPEMSGEAKGVANLLPDARVFLDGQATKARLLPELPNARLIHIASHGAFSPTDPSASALQLWDGPLTVKELQELHLQAELVVLSGCETGRSVTKGSDEILGLTQALLQAGARSALVSLWKVDDHSTAEFMSLFYSQLRTTPNRAEALRNAQLLQRQVRSHPYFWAPFILVGDPEPSAQKALSARCNPMGDGWTHSIDASNVFSS
jgi:CHAT domain-containing protein